MKNATETMVSSMACEAANSKWEEFVERTKKSRVHPGFMSGRENEHTVMRKIHEIAQACMSELQEFLVRLEPQECSMIGMAMWKEKYQSFILRVTEHLSQRAVTYSSLVNAAVKRLLALAMQLYQFMSLLVSSLKMIRLFQ
jgi:hypothetical protein